MNRTDPLKVFREEWSQYLREKGQTVSAERIAPSILTSRNGGGRRFSWFPLTAMGRTRTLSAMERRDIALHLREIKKEREESYVVIRFRRPTSKVVVIPARLALLKKRIAAARGGIPWED